MLSLWRSKRTVHPADLWWWGLGVGYSLAKYIKISCDFARATMTWGMNSIDCISLTHLLSVSSCVQSMEGKTRKAEVGEGVLLSSSVSVQSLSRVWLFVTPWTAARQASLSITNSQSLPKPMSIELLMPSNHLILCRPLLLLPSIFPSITVFSNESALHIRWQKYWSFSFSISPSVNTQDWSPLEWTGWISLQSKGLSSLLQQHSSKASILCTQLSL